MTKIADRENQLVGLTFKKTLAGDGGDSELIEPVVKTVNRVTTAWAVVIRWTISERCRIKGFYAAQRLKIDRGGMIRVARKTRDDIDQELYDRMAEIVANIEQRRRLLGPSRG